nr:MAG: hypothetical protein [Otus scops adenovirus]
MFPWQRNEFITHRELFPRLSMPPFKVACYLKKQTAWEIQYKCNCERPDSLFCRSLRGVVVKHWRKLIRTFLSQEDRIDPLPDAPIKNFCALGPYTGYSLYFDFFNPLTCLHFILTHSSVREHYAIGFARNIYHLMISPKYAHHRVLQCLRSLALAKRRLPFKLQVDYFPYMKMTFENIEDEND